MNYAVDMRARFNDTEFEDHMSKLVNLKQLHFVEEYYEEFEALLNLLQLSDEYSFSIFVSNLKPDLFKSVRLFHLNTYIGLNTSQIDGNHTIQFA